MDDYSGVKQLVVPPWLWGHLTKWLRQHGHVLAIMPDADPEDLLTYVVIPK